MENLSLPLQISCAVSLRSLVMAVLRAWAEMGSHLIQTMVEESFLFRGSCLLGMYESLVQLDNSHK